MNLLREFWRPIQNKIFLLTLVIVILTLLAVATVVEQTLINRFEEELGTRALNIADSVSQIPTVQENVGKEQGYQKIQPLADTIREKTNTEFVVVIDEEQRRYSHPVESRIGEKFVGGDAEQVLEGERYLSEAVGTLGPSLRAFSPIYNGQGEQVGAVTVGILLDDVQDAMWELRQWLIIATLLGLVLGIIGSKFLASKIKTEMFGMEPAEIAKTVSEKEGLLQSIKEGVIAIDRSGKIMFMNQQARNLLGVTNEDPTDRYAREYIPNSRLNHVIETGKPEFDREQNIGENTRIMTNRVPIKVEGEVVGAIASFRDMSEVHDLAEQLTGVKNYVEALRANNHEFSNKLHTILGLIQLQEYDRVVDYITEISDDYQNIVNFITRRIKDPAIGGLLIGKHSRSSELGIEFNLDRNSDLGVLKNQDSNNLVVIIGNLIENSIDALYQTNKTHKQITVSITSYNQGLYIKVSDNGPGISQNIQKHIFEKGISTKTEDGGYGLYLIDQKVKLYNGHVDFTSSANGTDFIVWIPIDDWSEFCVKSN